MSYQPTPIEPRSSVRARPRTLFLVGCGGLIAAFGLACIGVVVWLLVQPEGGVKLNNELSTNDRKHLAALGVARESVLAYLDRSFWQDGSDLAVLTTESLIHSKDGHQTITRLSEVEDMRHTTETMIGHSIELDLRGGRSMKINIPPLNSGDAFVNQLERALGDESSQ